MKNSSIFKLSNEKYTLSLLGTRFNVQERRKLSKIRGAQHKLYLISAENIKGVGILFAQNMQGQRKGSAEGANGPLISWVKLGSLNWSIGPNLQI